MPAVADLIGKNTVVVFSWVHCPFCVKAKAILAPLTNDLMVYEIDQMEGGGDMKAQIEKAYHHDTVPAIFIRGTFVGGCDTIEGLHKQGKLTTMISGTA